MAVNFTETEIQSRPGDLIFYCGFCSTVAELQGDKDPAPGMLARVENGHLHLYVAEGDECSHVIGFCEESTEAESWSLYSAALHQARLYGNETVFSFEVGGGSWDGSRWVVWPL